MENMQKMVDLVKGVDGLVTLPDIYIRINQLVEDQNSTLYDIASVISQDPAFTVHLLKVANSSFYGFPSVIDTVIKAVSVIGTSQIRNLALSLSVARTFAGLPNNLVSMENFWHHSLYCGLVARMVAKQVRRCDPEALFTAGLLHDIGELIIFNRMPAEAKVCLMRVLEHAEAFPVHMAEQEILGFDHTQVGGELAIQWHLPPLLIECISCHHSLAKAQRYKREVALIQIANSLALMAEIDTLNFDDVSPIEPEAWDISGFDQDCVEEIVREAQQGIVDAKKLFLA